MSVRSLLAAGTIAGTALGVLHPATAATSQATQDAIKAQQAQIDYLKQQLESMSEKLQQMQVKQATEAKAVEAKPAAPRVTQSATNRFALESADGQYSIGLTGGFQGDVGYYPGFDAKNKSIGPQNLNSGFNDRRARIGVTGKAAGDFSYTFIYDAGNSSDATPKGIETAQISYLGLKNFQFDIGYSNQLFTLDQSTSSYDTLFMERATPSNIATNLNTGDNRASVGGRYYTDRLWVGAYVTGPAVGDAHAQGERIGAFERIAYQVLADPEYSLHVGAGIDELIKAPLNNGAAAATTTTIDNSDPTNPKLVTSTVPSPYSISLSDQPELRVDTTTFASTGTLGSLTNPVTGAQVYDLELAGNWRNFYAQGEYYHYNINRRNLDTTSFDGGYGEVAWTLTGESHKYNPASGSYGRIIPAHAFDPSQGYWGAWEVAGRVSYIDLTSNFTAGKSISSTSQPSAVNGGKQTSFTAGLNWYPNNYMRLELNYIHTDFDKANSGSSGTLGAPIGATIDALGLRTQVTW
ncbi:MAG TPA: porin [Alphaproteobacteria bacterium]|jgi:phosphate-selective porin OprO/OprP|nr:porin [Alphaproteobacteria bacterium]